MSSQTLAAELLGAQHHGPGGAAHLVLLAGAAVVVLAIVGISRWRKRRDATLAEQSDSDDHSTETTRSTEQQ